MSEEQKIEGVEPEGTETESCLRCRFGLFIVLFLVALVGGFILRDFLLPSDKEVENPSPLPQVTQLEETVHGLAGRVERVEALLSEQQKLAVETKTGASSEEMELLKAEIKKVTEEASALKGEIRKAATDSSASQRSLKTEWSLVLSFLQLQNKVLTGKPFSFEWRGFQGLVGGDPVYSGPLAQLEQLASKGVPTWASLVRQWPSLSLRAQNALQAVEATTWQDRILAALKSLVSIRSLSEQGATHQALQAIGADLEREDAKAVLEKVDALPPAVQEIVKMWREQLDARQKAEEALDEISIRLTPVPVETDEKASPDPDKETP